MSSCSSKNGIQVGEKMISGTESDLFDPVGHMAFSLSLLQLYTSKLSNIVPEDEGEQVSFTSASMLVTG